MKYLILLIALVGCATNKPLDPMFADESKYVIERDQHYRYRIIMPDGDDMGVRLESYDEARIAIEFATETAEEMILMNEMVEHQRFLDKTAKWRKVNRE